MRGSPGLRRVPSTLALAAVDSAGDESVKSAPAAVTIPQADGSSSAAGGGGGCFVASVGSTRVHPIAPVQRPSPSLRRWELYRCGHTY